MTAVPAVLQAAVEGETPYGGRAQAWSDVATVWVELAWGAASATPPAADQRPVRIETATATGGDHPAASAGQRLVVGADPPWRVLAVRRDPPGRMTLSLDRAL